MIGHAMLARHYRQMIVDAVEKGDGTRLDKIAGQLMDCEQAKHALRLKGYGDACMSAVAAVRLVPATSRKESQQRKG